MERYEDNESTKVNKYFMNCKLYNQFSHTGICNDTEKKVKELESKENERIEVMDDYSRMLKVSANEFLSLHNYIPCLRSNKNM
jgi:hypothetical protein